MRGLAFFFCILAAVPCEAEQFRFQGYADLRLVAPDTSEKSWIRGGLGKFRYGDGDLPLQLADIVGQGTFLITPELMTTAVARINPRVVPAVDLLEAFVRYRPVSTTRWRWSLKAGAFFAPMSLENTEVGWAPYWTITASAINSWYGEELRTIGGEFAFEWRGDEDNFTAIGSLNGLNQPAGVLLADRGWALSDTATGLFEHPRLPDVTATLHHLAVPAKTPMFVQYSGDPGWYLGLVWKDADGWRAEAYRYDNEADPAAHNGADYGWRTKFWDFGLSKQIDAFSFLAQAVTGNTAVSPGRLITTDFDSAYLLAGWEEDAWRLALRAETFHTRTYSARGASPTMSEYGSSVTAAATWLPTDWIKVSGEAIYIDSMRPARSVAAIAPRQRQVQFQLAIRAYLD